MSKEPALILKKRVVTPPPAPAHAPTGPRTGGRATRATAQIQSGTILQDRYRITAPLGMGGMSTVYKAVDLRFTNVERICAVKEMFDTAGDDKTREQRMANFEREAGLLAVLSHPLIPKIYDFFFEKGNSYLVMEFVPGQNLETLLDNTPDGFSESELIDWTTQICDVLMYLHGQQPDPVIFRDLKPSNIMVREDRSLMLIDFGIARAFQQYQRGTMIGTEGYAPPEQYRGVADVRTDIYALGATLHHLATGSDPRFETPFTFDQRPPRQLNPRLSPQLEAVILRAVAYAPNDRFATAAEFKAALLACRRGKARPPGSGKIEALLPAAPAVPKQKPVRTRILPTITAADPPAAAPVPERPPLAPVTERLAWVTTTGDEVRGSGVVTDRLLLIGSYDARLHALDLRNGIPQWQFVSGRGICATPAIWRDTAIVGSEDGAVYCVALSNGELRWRYRTGMPVRSSPRLPTNSSVAANGVYVGSDDNFVYKLDPATGNVLWRTRTYGPVRSSATFTDNLVLIGSDDGFIYALDQETGRQVWRFATGKSIFASPAVDAERDIAVCGSLDGLVYGVSLINGDPRWRYDTQGPVVASAALRDGRAYVGSTAGRFLALDMQTGERLWEVSHGGRVSSSAAVTRGYIYYGGLDGSVCCLDRANGALVWSHVLGRPVPASPVLHEGFLFIGGLDGKVYALATGELGDVANGIV